MDLSAFLRAQLWLYGPLPSETWPPHRGCARAHDSDSTRDGKDEASDVASPIFPPCHCSFLLRDGPGSVGWSGGISRCGGGGGGGDGGGGGGGGSGGSGASGRSMVQPLLLRARQHRKRKRRYDEALNVDAHGGAFDAPESKARPPTAKESSAAADAGPGGISEKTSRGDGAVADAAAVAATETAGREGDLRWEHADPVETHFSFEAAILGPSGSSGSGGGAGALFFCVDGATYFVDHSLICSVTCPNRGRPAATAAAAPARNTAGAGVAGANASVAVSSAAAAEGSHSGAKVIAAGGGRGSSTDGAAATGNAAAVDAGKAAVQLIFPNVILKFWLAGSTTRAVAVEALIGGMDAMTAALSLQIAHPLAAGADGVAEEAAQECVAEEFAADGFSRQLTAWRNFHRCEREIVSPPPQIVALAGLPPHLSGVVQLPAPFDCDFGGDLEAAVGYSLRGATLRSSGGKSGRLQQLLAAAAVAMADSMIPAPVAAQLHAKMESEQARVEAAFEAGVAEAFPTDLRNRSQTDPAEVAAELQRLQESVHRVRQAHLALALLPRGRV